MSTADPIWARLAAHFDVADFGDVAEVAAAIAATLTVTSSRWSALAGESSTVRTGVRVLSNERYDVWFLRWPEGASVDPHDHGPSVGGFAVVAGALEEIRWNGGTRRSNVVRPGQAVTVERGCVHDVVGVTEGALSVHVYAPPLQEMTFYDASGQVALRREPVDAGTMGLSPDREDANAASGRGPDRFAA